MSDGPHRSLNHPPPWRKLAQAAEQLTSTVEEVGQRREEALQSELKKATVKEAIREIRKAADARHGDLFTTDGDIISDVRCRHGDTELVALWADHLERFTDGGRTLAESMEPALVAALKHLDANHGRSAEEHCVREVHRRPRELAPNLPVIFRERLKESRQYTAFGELAAAAVRGEAVRTKRRVQDHTEDGPPLP